jgi:hypothetical protein
MTKCVRYEECGVAGVLARAGGPQRPKPSAFAALIGTAEAVPYPNPKAAEKATGGESRFWVAQRFSAAIKGLVTFGALAPEGGSPR